MKKIKISDFCDIRFGVALTPDNTGDIPYIQISQFDDKGTKNNEKQERVKNSGKLESYFLQPEDILFAGKGSKLFAWDFKWENRPVIASSSFFVLRPHSNIVDPGFLVTYLNTNQAKAAFLQLGAGTKILSLRKSELAAFEIPLLPLPLQKKLAELAQLHQKEKELTQGLIEQKQNLFDALISKMIN